MQPSLPSLPSTTILHSFAAMVCASDNCCRARSRWAAHAAVEAAAVRSCLLQLTHLALACWQLQGGWLACWRP
jgi:hypothetical protein